MKRLSYATHYVYIYIYIGRYLGIKYIISVILARNNRFTVIAIIVIRFVLLENNFVCTHYRYDEDLYGQIDYILCIDNNEDKTMKI